MGVRLELSRCAIKKALAINSFHIGDVFRFLVTMGVAKRTVAFYSWLYSRLPAIADYQVG